MSLHDRRKYVLIGLLFIQACTPAQPTIETRTPPPAPSADAKENCADLAGKAYSEGGSWQETYSKVDENKKCNTTLRNCTCVKNAASCSYKKSDLIALGYQPNANCQTTTPPPQPNPGPNPPDTNPPVNNNYGKMLIYGIHDQGGEHYLKDANGNANGWMLAMARPMNNGEADYSMYNGIHVLLRLDYYGEGNQTVPKDAAKIDTYCAAVKGLIGKSRNVYGFILGNEPNLSTEGSLSAQEYANAFNKCFDTIAGTKTADGKDGLLFPAPVAPYTDAEESYFRDIVTLIPADKWLGLPVHVKTRNCNKGDDSCLSPNGAKKADFEIYQRYAAMFKDITKKGVPIYITESDPHYDDGSTSFWRGEKGWIEAAFDNIDAWNKSRSSDQDLKVHGMMLFRFDDAFGRGAGNPDVWEFGNLPEVRGDFKKAFDKGYFVGQ